MQDDLLLRLGMTAAYVAAAFLSFASARRSHSRERVAWISIGATLLAFAVGKQLAVLGDVTAGLRALARAKGVYGSHREAQAFFAVLIMLLAALSALPLARYLHGSDKRVRAAAGASAALIAFMLLRLPSIHWVDGWITARIAGMRVGWWIELAAIAAICGSAVAYRRSPAGYQ